MLSATIKGADCLICDSNFAKKELLAYYPQVQHKVEVIPLGIDIQCKQNIRMDEQVLHKLGIKQPFLLYVGTIAPHKHIVKLIKAFHQLKKQGQDVQLVIAGKKGWMYDETGVYVPYTHKNEEYYDHRNVFLKIERQSSKNELKYTLVKLEERLFYPISSSYISKVLINEYDEYLVREISRRGIYCGLNTQDEVFINFVEQFKTAIIDADCLDVLKNMDFTIVKEENMINLTVDKKKIHHHNFMNMQDLVMMVTGQIPKKFGRIHNTHVNLFTTGDSVEVFQSVLKCSTTKKQYDQTGFLMEYFDLDTPQEAEEKFQELLQ